MKPGSTAGNNKNVILSDEHSKESKDPVDYRQSEIIRASSTRPWGSLRMTLLF